MGKLQEDCTEEVAWGNNIFKKKKKTLESIMQVSN